MKLKNPLTADQANQIGKLFDPSIEWNIFPLEQLPKEARWNGIDLISIDFINGTWVNWMEENRNIQINLNENLEPSLSIMYYNNEGECLHATKEQLEQILQILG